MSEKDKKDKKKKERRAEQEKGSFKFVIEKIQLLLN